MSLVNLYLGLFMTVLSVSHEYHVGIYHLYFKENGIQISQKLFIDDFEKALMLSGKSVKIGDDLKDEKVAKALREYILEHFSLSTDKDKLDMIYVGAEWEDYHTIYLYWEVNDLPDDLNEILIKNSIFLEVSSDQQNMHHIHIDEDEQSLLLERNKTEGEIRVY